MQWPKKRHLALAADDPAAGEPFRILAQAVSEDGEPVAEEQSPRLARIEISGTLVGETSFFGRFFGGETSFDQIQAAISEADASPADTTLLVMRTPGGDFSGMGETAAVVRGASNRIVAWAPKAFSAGFGIISGANKIAMPPDGLVGSLSVFAVMIDESKAALDAGVEVTVHSPDVTKGAGFPGAPVPVEAKKATDELVVKLKAQFADILAEGRDGLDPKALAPLMKAQTFTAPEALEAGLVDEIHDTEAAFVASLFSTNDTEDGDMPDTKKAEGEQSAAVAGETLDAQAAGSVKPPDVAAMLAESIAQNKETAAQLATLTATVATIAPMVAQTADDRLRAQIEATGAPNVAHQMKVCKALPADLLAEHLADLKATATARGAFASMLDGEQDVYETTDAAGERVLIDRSGGMLVDAADVDQQDARLHSLASAYAAKKHEEGTPEYDKDYDAFCAKAERKEAQA